MNGRVEPDATEAEAEVDVVAGPKGAAVTVVGDTEPEASPAADVSSGDGSESSTGAAGPGPPLPLPLLPPVKLVERAARRSAAARVRCVEGMPTLLLAETGAAAGPLSPSAFHSVGVTERWRTWPVGA